MKREIEEVLEPFKRCIDETDAFDDSVGNPRRPDEDMAAHYVPDWAQFTYGALRRARSLLARLKADRGEDTFVEVARNFWAFFDDYNVSNFLSALARTANQESEVMPPEDRTRRSESGTDNDSRSVTDATPPRPSSGPEPAGGAMDAAQLRTRDELEALIDNPPPPNDALRQLYRDGKALQVQPSAPDSGDGGAQYIDIVFDGPPSHESGRFVEVENERGQSIKFGGWVHRLDGYWALRIPQPAPPPALAADVKGLRWLAGDDSGKFSEGDKELLRRAATALESLAAPALPADVKAFVEKLRVRPTIHLPAESHRDTIGIIREMFIERSKAANIIESLASRSAEGDWHFDMENAPRDGTRIVLWVPELDPPTIQAQWSSYDAGWPEAGHWVDVWNNDAIETNTAPVEPKGWLILPPPREGGAS